MGARYEVRKTKCNCHRETCPHWAYYVFDTLLEVDTGWSADSKSECQVVADRYNEANDGYNDYWQRLARAAEEYIGHTCCSNDLKRGIDLYRAWQKIKDEE